MTEKLPTPDRSKVIGKPEVEEGDARHSRNAYSLRNFYVTATDQHHNKSTVKLENGRTLAMPPFIVALISEIIDDESNPYRTAFDFLRDAAVHRLHWFKETSDSPFKAWDTFQEMAEIERSVSDANRQEQQVTRTIEILDVAWKKGDMELYNNTLVAGRKMVPKLRSPYRERLDTELGKARQASHIRPV